MATADFLDQTRTEIAARLNELRPLVDEYQRLEAAVAALENVAASTVSSTSTASARRTPARRAPARRRAASDGRRARSKGGGKRADEALAMVTASPGITIPEIAQRMGIKQNYLYRVLPGLAGDGLVVRDGRGWKPKEKA